MAVSIGMMNPYMYNPYGSYSSYTGSIGGSTSMNATDQVNGSANPDEVKKPGRKSSPEDCETCKNRKYQDGSDEMVSFKSAQHVAPESAGAAVRGHEQEHVSNAYKKAAEKGGQVINASVSIQTAICPECGRSYVAGGTTNTQIKYKNEENPYQKSLKSSDQAKYKGMHLDLAV